MKIQIFLSIEKTRVALNIETPKRGDIKINLF